MNKNLLANEQIGQIRGHFLALLNMQNPEGQIYFENYPRKGTYQ